MIPRDSDPRPQRMSASKWRSADALDVNLSLFYYRRLANSYANLMVTIARAEKELRDREEKLADNEVTNKWR